MNSINPHSFPKAPQGFHNRICRTLADLPDRKEVHNMKRRKYTKLLVVAAVLTAVLTTAAFAGGTIGSFLTSQNAFYPTFDEFPTTDQIEQSMGCTPKLIEAFTNGYTFDSAHISGTEMHNASGNITATFENLELLYKLEQSEVTVIVSNRENAELSNGAAPIRSAGMPTLYYRADAYKFVPADYQMTEQDLRDEADGTYVFSWGSDAVEIEQIQFLGWNENGMRYSIMAIDSALTQADLTAMAQEIIAQP